MVPSQSWVLLYIRNSLSFLFCGHCMAAIRGEKYVWHIPDAPSKAVCDIAARYNLSFPIAQTLVARGFVDPEKIDEYLFTSYERDVAHPGGLKDSQKAVERIITAINNKEKILVFGDYDVDGITSSSLMMMCLLPLGAQVNFFLPHRVRDGYGLSTKVVERAAENGYTLIVTVDNGITAIEPVQKANERGVDVIITDHHRPHADVPLAYAIVNPNQTDCDYAFKQLAGVGVIFKVLSLLYEKLGKQLPAKAYELLLLGTIADVVPLQGENRYWVRHGLQHIAQAESFSFKVLKENGKVTKPLVSSKDIGFSIAPQINALGRLEDPRQAVRFLIGTDQDEIQRVGKVLLELNEARKTIERSILSGVVQQIESKSIDLETENIICAASSNWPPGVIGLVASRLVGQYGRPTLLFHATKDGLAKGSCRSIPAFNMFDALEASKDLLTSFGGHSLAAGLSLPIDRLPELKERLEERIAEQLTPEDLSQTVTVDAAITLGDVTKKLVTDMHLLEPFGHGNNQPTFCARKVTLVAQPQLLKNAHVKCQVFADGVIKPIIFFNRPELFELLIDRADKPFDVAFEVSENHWNGKVTIQLLGIDVGVVDEE